MRFPDRRAAPWVGVLAAATLVASDALVPSEAWGEKRSARAPHTQDDQGWSVERADDEERWAVHDLWITTRARMELVAQDQVSVFDIDVETRDGVVTVFGIVPSEGARRAAEEEIEEIGGVRAVRNALQVVPPDLDEAVATSDEHLEASLERTFAQRSDLDDADVDVEVAAGVVRLTGEVRGSPAHMTAITVARQMPGVRGVVDDLRVEHGPGTGAPPRARAR